MLEIHDLYLGLFGGFPGVRDENVFEACVARAQWKWRLGGAGIAECAAAYAYTFATAHAFNDGNKRTSFYSAVAFLLLNGYELEERDAEEARDVIVAVAMRRLDEVALATWFRDRIVERGAR